MTTGRIVASGRIPVSGRIVASGRISSATRRTGMMEFIGNGLVSYYRSDLETITLTAGKISQWADISGNGKHATQSTSSRRPTVTSNWIETVNGIAFTSATVLGIASLLQVNRFPITMGGVWQSTSNTAARTIFAPTGAGGGTYLGIHTSSLTTRDINSNQIGPATDGTPTTNAEVWIVTIESNANPTLGTYTLYLTTSNTLTTLTGATRSINTTTGSTAFIGAINAAVAQPFTGGTIGEIFIMDRLMTTVERSKYLAYVQSRYGTI